MWAVVREKKTIFSRSWNMSKRINICWNFFTIGQPHHSSVQKLYRHEASGSLFATAELLVNLLVTYLQVDVVGPLLLNASLLLVLTTYCRAMLCISAAYAVMRCVCVCLSRSWIVSKRINVASKFLHRRVATPFQLFHAKRHSNIPTGTPITGASNAGGVGRNCDSEHVSAASLSGVNAATGQMLST